MENEAVEITLTNGMKATVSACDLERVSQYRWLYVKAKCRTAYVARCIGRRKRQMLHRFILEIADPSIQIDHKDNDGLNNTRENIRICTGSQNRGNCRKPRIKNASSKFKGVCRNGKRAKWRAFMAEQYLGSFISEEEAARAYDAAALSRFGADFAQLNFPIHERLALKGGKE